MRKLGKKREVDEVEDFYDTLLRSGPFPGDDAPEALCNAVLKQINDHLANGDEIDAELLLPELKTAIINMVHGGRDPNSVPYKYIRHALDNPVGIYVTKEKDEWVTHNARNDYPHKLREGVDGPLRAVRLFCIGCQGGSPELVRACPSIDCFLWSFRMAGNPFYGRLIADQNDDDDGYEGADIEADADAEFAAEEAERFNKDQTNANS